MDFTPTNYGIDLTTPLDGYFQGLKDKQARELQQAQINSYNQQTEQAKQQGLVESIKAQQEAEIAKQKQFAIATMSSKNPSLEDLKRASAILNPQKSAESALANMDENEKRTNIQQGIMASSAFQNGNFDLGVQIIDDYATSLENSNNSDKAKQVRAYKEYALKLPEKNRNEIMANLFNSMIAQDPEGEKIIQANLGKPQAEIKSTEATTNKNIKETEFKNKELQNYDANIAIENEQKKATTGNLLSQTTERDMNVTNPKISEYASKQNDADNNLILETRNTKNKISNILKNLDKINETGGSLTQFGNFIERSLGVNNLEQSVSRDIADLENDYIMSKKFDNTTTNADRELIVMGYPKNADSDVQKRYFKTYQKVLDIKENYLNKSIEWRSQVGSLSNAPRNISMGGQKVLAGTSFFDYFDKAPLQKKQINQNTDNQQPATKKNTNDYLKNRSWMKI